MEKRILHRIVRLAFGLTVVAFAMVWTVSPAIAVPTLQLYSSGSTYDADTDSWLTLANPFELQVLGADHPNQLNLVDGVKLHIAIPSEFFNSLGTVTIEGISSSLESAFTAQTFTNSDFQQGIPPELAGWSGNARTHDVYQDAYFVSVLLDNLQVNKTPADTIINYVDIAQGELPPGTDTGDIDIYRITYNDIFLIHTDLTGMTRYTNSNRDAMKFAPFSHDADAVVPEPSTILLLSSGLLGLGIWGKNRKRR